MSKKGATMIKLSILDQSLIAAGRAPQETLQQTIQLAQAADAWGYTRYWTAEHHNGKGLAHSSPEVLVAALAAKTNRIRVGSGGVLLPHYSAYKVAENFRLLEALYPQRIDLGIGRAPGGTPYTAKALRDGKADIFEGLERFPEQLADLCGFLTDSLAPGHRFEGIMASPLIETAPQLWLLGSSIQSGVYAAEIGSAFCFAHFINGSGGQEVVRKYQQEFRASFMNVVPQAMVGIFVVCADTDAEAERLAGSTNLMFLKINKGELGGGIPSVEEAEGYPYSDADHKLMAENRSRMIVGDPVKVKEQLVRLADSYQVQEIMITTAVHRFEARLRSYELLSEVFKLKS
jgi:luciferase family oxidoreductase group 1